jgi:hypothetical protein
MRRRDFIKVIAGPAIGWPLAARAQQEQVRRLGVLVYLAAGDREGEARLAAFTQALTQLGWSEGRNLRIDVRWAKADDVHRHAAELVALTPDVLLAATGTATVAPLLQATRAIPIVFATVIDPVGAGFIASLAQPGGNATGFTIYEYSMSGKWLGLLKEDRAGGDAGGRSPRRKPRAAGRQRHQRCSAMNFRISTDWSLISIVVLLASGSCLSASASIDRDIAASSRICLASSRGMRPFLTSAR